MKKQSLGALCTLSALAFNLGCSQKNLDTRQAGENLNFKSLSTQFAANRATTVSTNNTKKLDNIKKEYEKIKHSEIPYEELTEIDDKISYIVKTLFEFKVQIEKLNSDEQSDQEVRIAPKYRISSTLYPSPIEFDTIDHLHKKIQVDVFEHFKSNRILQFEQEFQVKIRPILGNSKYTFELTADWLSEKMFFKDLGSLEAAVKNGYHIQKVDSITKIFRLIRNKSIKNVSTLSPFHAQKAFVIDGADDLATALESSGLSQKLIYIIQGIGFYPAFLYLVHSGTEGAAAQHQELKQEVKELILQSYEQELKLKETLNHLILAKSNTNEIQHLYFSHLKSKVNTLQILNQIYNNENLTNTLTLLKSELQKTTQAQDIHTISLADLPTGIKDTLKQLSQMPEFDLKNPKSIEFISQLAEYKATREETIKTYIEQKIPGALTEGGLMAMFSGMAAFELRAVAGYAHLELFKDQFKAKTKEDIQSAIKDSSLFEDLTKIKDSFVGNSAEPLFSGALGILTKLGDGFLALGQAQMFLGGLVNIKYGIDEVKSLREWMSIVEKSELWEHSTSETKKLRSILADFYKKQSILTIFKTTGDVLLTTGQFAMLMGGPLAFESLPTTVSGASATILGVATKQAFEKIIELYYEFDDAPDNSKEAKIIAGEFDQPEDHVLNKFAKRIDLLNQLTMERSKLRVWQKLYLELQNHQDLNKLLERNPNYIQEKILPKLRTQFLSGAKYHQFYLDALTELFPEPLTAEKQLILNNNIAYLKKAAEYLNAAKSNKKSMLLFHRFTVQHLAELKNNLDNPTQNISSAQEINVERDLTQMGMDVIAKEIKAVFDYLALLGVDAEFEHKIVSRIIKGEGALFGDKDLLHLAQEYISTDKSRVISTEQKASLFAGATSVTSFYKNYYFPFLDLTPIKSKLSNIFFTSENKSKEKIIYYFDKEKFLKDLSGFETLSSEKQTVLSTLLHAIFINPPDSSKIRGKFGNDKRTPIKKIMEGIYAKINRQETLRPVLKYTIAQLEMYDMMKSVMGLTNNSPNHKLIQAKKIANKIVMGMNHANILVNFYHLPNRLLNIHEQSINGEHFSAARNSLEIALDNADLVVDLVRGTTMLQKHAHLYKNLGRAQAGLNIATAGFEVWNAVDMFKQVPTATGKQKQDYIVYGTTSTLSAAASVGTLAALPFTSMAGPIGTAIGFSIMMGQNIYSTARTHEELVDKFGMPPNDAAKLGAAKLLCPMCDISKSRLFEPYQRDYVKKQELAQHITELNKNSEKSNIVFTKLVTPKPFYYFPVTPQTYVTSSCNMGGCSTSSSGGYVVNNNIHLCQTSNSYNSTEEKISQQLFNNLKLNNYEVDHKKFFFEEERRIKNMSFWQKFFASYQVYDFSRYCKEDNVKNFVKMDEYLLEKNLENNIKPEKKTTLFYVGLGDQFRHGYALSKINGDVNVKNYFLVEKGQYKYELNGANKDDYFEIKAPSRESGEINGKEGLNVLNLQNFDFNSSTQQHDKVTFIIQSKKQLEQDIVNYNKLNNSSINTSDLQKIQVDTTLTFAKNNKKEQLQQFPTVENITHFFGSKFKDIYLGSSKNELLLGGNGNDTLAGGLGDDILSGGEDIDTLIGGAGRDTYLINKVDYLNNKENYDIIYFANQSNYKYNIPHFFTQNSDERDVIITDIQQIGVYSENDDLWFVTNDKDILAKQSRTDIPFVKLFKLENYKEGSQIVKNIPILISKDKYIFLFDPKEVKNNVTWIDTISPTPDAFLDSQDLTELDSVFQEKRGANLNKLPLSEHISHIIGNMNSEILIGNNKDNLIDSAYGNAYIKGLDGNDTLTAYLDHSKQERLVIMDGGKGDDIFLVNITDYNHYQPNNIPIIKITDESKITNGKLSIKVSGSYAGLKFDKFYINTVNKNKRLYIKNYKGEILFIIELTDNLKLESIFIEIGEKRRRLISYSN